ncbi:MAG: TonB-dependent receptor [Sphingomonas sp.]|uniref:TonB-dependent receptor plug domain-containing protein n=1 Tax=Sphingomonas sp. TaxID=28214 RepID=UPI00122A33A8|nr:TonB-dependent receptor [Sphingomonas sp.]THD37689.1 MAG: TonB-dependent receptor [Sphingomonas sp.]
MRRAIITSLLTVSAIALATPAFAQTAPADAQAADDASGKDIVITGSRIPGRTVADSPVPIDVIAGDTLSNSGQTETNKLLNQLVPSFNFPQPSLTDGTDSLRPATLRGLQPDQALVLINGKRRHQAALINLNGSVGRGATQVDLNEIPPIAIDRIEVLRDGASSQYGSDAIAGVINIQLSKKVGVSGSVTFGKYDTTMDGVNDVIGVATTGGVPTVMTPGANAQADVLALNYGNERKRHDGDTLTLAARVGLPVGDGGYLTLSAQFRDRDPTNRSGADPRRQYFNVGDPRELTFDRFSHGYGDGKAVDYNLFLNAGIDIGPNFQLYTFGSYGIRDGIGAGFYRRSNDARNRDFAASTVNFVPYYPDGFLPKIYSQIEDVSAAVGIKGDVAGFDADLSVVYGSNQLDYQTIDSFNVSLGGAVSPRRFDAGGLAFGQTTANLDLSKKFDVGGFSSFGIAFGAEYRDENFKIRAGNVASYVGGPYIANGAAPGAQVFPGFKPANAIDISRNSVAGYAEVDADISKQFTLQAAGRYEHFSDFGDTVNGKLAARFEPIKGIAVRGSISTGFRAPSLAQQYFSTTSTNNVGGVLIDIVTVPATSPIGTALGGKPLKAEKALNLAGGIALNPISGLSITADYYNIRIKDRVTLTDNLTGTAVVNLLTGAGIGGVSSARFFVNGVDTRTQGLDVVASYRVPDFGAGKFVLTAGYNYNETKIIKRASLPTLPGLVLFGRQESFRLTDGQPRTKLNLSVDWDLGIVGATLRTNRYGTVWVANAGALTAPLGSVAGDFALTPKWVTDVELRVTPIKQVTLAIGADNVFDTYPDRLPTGGATGAPGFTPNSYFIPYSQLSPFGFNGRFIYGRVAFNF